VTDPPDPLADIARNSAGHGRILSTGTFLDSLRFRVHLAQHFEVDAIRSSPDCWRTRSVAGVPLVERPHCRCADRRDHQGARRNPRESTGENRKQRALRQYHDYRGNDASQFGIGIVSARIAEIVLRDERAVLPIGSYNERSA